MDSKSQIRFETKFSCGSFYMVPAGFHMGKILTDTTGIDRSSAWPRNVAFFLIIRIYFCLFFTVLFVVVLLQTKLIYKISYFCL